MRNSNGKVLWANRLCVCQACPLDDHQVTERPTQLLLIGAVPPRGVAYEILFCTARTWSSFRYFSVISDAKLNFDSSNSIVSFRTYHVTVLCKVSSDVKLSFKFKLIPKFYIVSDVESLYEIRFEEIFSLHLRRVRLILLFYCYFARYRFCYLWMTSKCVFSPRQLWCLAIAFSH